MIEPGVASLQEDFRPEFFDSVQELCDTLDHQDDYQQIVWKIEYLTRNERWYHYYGISRRGQSSSVGQEYDLTTGSNRDADPATFVFTLLDFDNNIAIGAYCGNKTAATDILQELELSGADRPEVVRISLETRSTLPGGRRVMSVTDFAYIGLRRPIDLALRNIARSKDGNARWCRGRRFIQASHAMITHTA